METRGYLTLSSQMWDQTNLSSSSTPLEVTSGLESVLYDIYDREVTASKLTRERFAEKD